jgi:hypothetical protein
MLPSYDELCAGEQNPDPGAAAKARKTLAKYCCAPIKSNQLFL